MSVNKSPDQALPRAAGRGTQARRSLLAVLALATAIGCSACGSSSSSSSTSTSSSTPSSSTPTIATASEEPSIAAMVPAAIKSKGEIVAAADATYAPNEFIGPDGKTIVGMDADLSAALGQVMGVKINLTNVTFDSIIPGLAAGKYDMGISSFTDTKEREKTVIFVTYFVAGVAFYVKAQGGPTVSALSELCGRTVSVEKGTTEAEEAAEQSKKCTTSGKKAVTVNVYPDQNGANLAISSGRAEIGMADSPVAAYIVKQSQGQFKLVGKGYGNAPYGIAFPKGSGLDKPVLAALKVLMAKGIYMSILEKWGVQAGAISNPTINGATG